MSWVARRTGYNFAFIFYPRDEFWGIGYISEPGLNRFIGFFGF
jgi:hypothetical protein